jgi:hypothetical protein
MHPLIFLIEMKTTGIAREEPYDDDGNKHRVAGLRSLGVEVWGPERVYVGPDVPLENIEPGAILKNAVLTGQSTLIGCGSTIGTSGMAVMNDCQVGRSVRVGAGHYDGATLLAGSQTRGFAELRPGTLLEEEAEIAHNVGLKHTIFTVAVVAGSSINFCDALVTGGTRRSDHSEIGSGTVHFNFDPRGDKFGSLIGDVRGVLLRSQRIFVGGNSGLVAPLHLDFGTVIAAGSTVRSDVDTSQMCQTQPEHTLPVTFDPGIYFDMKRKFVNTAKLVGNLHALAAWYLVVRLQFAVGAENALYRAALQQVQLHIKHRIAELDKVIVKLEILLSRGHGGNAFYDQHRRVVDARAEITRWLSVADGQQAPPMTLLSEYEALRSRHAHCEAIRTLSDNTCRQAEEWLMHIPLRMASRMSALFTRSAP